MKIKQILPVISTVFLSQTSNAQVHFSENDIDRIISQMTAEEKALILVGVEATSNNGSVLGYTNGTVPGAAGATNVLKKYGIIESIVTDGPAGVRISPFRNKDSSRSYYATAFPIGTAIASTWNQPLIENIGKALGNETIEYNCDVLLAPALNIQRNPLCGRNFEYYSEDPLVSGKTAAAYVRGVQSMGVGTSIKHFVANNQETKRMSINEHISQRALREIYLKGFEIAVKESNPWTVMTSYNKVNGTYTSESKDLLTTILRKEWGYKGLVMTDWLGGYDFPLGTEHKTSNVIAQISAGNDLLMPGTPNQKNAIIEAIHSRKIAMETVNTSVKRVLEYLLKTPKYKNYVPSERPDLNKNAIIAREASKEAIVLLKNENALPISKTKTIAAFGNTSYDFISGGRGSGDVNSAYTISLMSGLENANCKVDQILKNYYVPIVNRAKDSAVKKPFMLGGVFPMVLKPKESWVDKQTIQQAANNSDVAIITIGRMSGEFLDRKYKAGDYLLDSAETDLINNVSEAFHATGKKVIVVLNICGVIETSSWKDKVDGILSCWQLGQEGGNSVADILSGGSNPSGKLTMTFPMKYSDVPAVGDSTFGGVPINTPPNTPGEVFYKEGVYVGYRYYSSFNIPVAFPFGFGLSYTQFKFSNLNLSESKKEYTFSLQVTNIGDKAGKEVVQLYVTPPSGKSNPPIIELKAYQKTRLLSPNESENMHFSITPEQLAYFDETSSSWVVEKGDYTIKIGNSSDNHPLIKKIQIKKRIVVKKVDNVLAPDTSFRETISLN